MKFQKGQPPPERRWRRVGEVAELLSLSEKTIWKLISRGDLIAVKLGRIWLVDSKALFGRLNAQADEKKQAVELASR